MESEIKTIIETAIGQPAECDASTIMPPCATFSIYLEDGLIFGDGKSEQDKANIQIDLWYKNKLERDLAVISLKQAIALKYAYPSVQKLYDTTAKLYRATFNFEALIEREV